MTFEFDYLEAEAFLVGHCHKTTREAMMVSMEEFRYLSKAYEREQQIQWEQLRWLSYNNLATVPFAKKDAMPASPQDYCRFPWEEEEKKKKKVPSRALSAAEVAELYRLYQDFNKTRS